MLHRNKISLYKLNSTAQTLLLMAALAVLLGYFSWLLLGPSWAITAVFAVIAIYWINPARTPWLLLRMMRARPINMGSVPALQRVLHGLTVKAGLSKMPTLYVLPEKQLNAFAAGSDRAPVIALSHGLLQNLTLDELTGVLAHEVSHIQHQDVRLMSYAQMVTRLTRTLSTIGKILLFINIPLLLMGQLVVSWWLVVLLVAAPRLATAIQLALSRVREYKADLGAAALMGSPDPLIRALARMQGHNRHKGLMWDSGAQNSLMSTHPDTRKRIQRLVALRERPEFAQSGVVYETPNAHTVATPVSCVRLPLKTRVQRPSGWRIGFLAALAPHI